MQDKPSFSFLSPGLGDKLQALSAGRFYDKIVPTNDLIKNPLLTKFPALAKDEFYIAPPKETLDRLAMELLKELAGEMEKWDKVPGTDKVLEDEIKTLIDGKKKEGNSSFQEVLQKTGGTGIITQTIAKLNASALVPIDRAILSHKPLAFYAFYRAKALLGGKLEDIEGVVSSVLQSLQKVKSYINTKAVDEVMRINGLDGNRVDPNGVKDKVKDLALSYVEGELHRAIMKAFDDLKDGVANLVKEVKAFLSSSAVTVPAGTDREVLIKKMVDYLIKIGYKEGGSVDPLTKINERLDSIEATLNTLAPEKEKILERRDGKGKGEGESGKIRPEKATKKSELDKPI